MIVGQLLVDHALSYALTAIANVPAVITYTVDMFCATLKLPMETSAHPFIAPATLKYIQPFLKIVGYQGLVDKVSAFYMKNLSQPLHTMFKVFNRFHVDYANLIWWDFLHCLKQKKQVIQYPRFTKLIIADLIKKFDFIPRRLEEDYHSIKDDVPLVSVYTTGNVTIKRMLIPDEFLTNDIRETKEYKDYAKEFVGVDIPTIKPQPVESTQWTNRTPNPAAVVDNIVPKKRKGKQVAGETSSSRKSLKQPYEASLYTNKLKLLRNKKTCDFADYVFLNEEEDSGTRIDPGKHKENPKTVDDDEEKKDDTKDDDDDDNDDHTDHALMKSNLQDQAANPELWDVLKNKFEASYALTSSCRNDAFRKRHHEDDALPEGEKRVKRRKE
ncbi:hypothetical protein Tco_0634975 [Tanacetum coccineum]